MLHVAICDSDRQFCSYLESIIHFYGKQNSLIFRIHTYLSGREFHHCMSRDPLAPAFHIVFLNLAMEKENAIEIDSYVRARMNTYEIQIVYIASHMDYAADLLHFYSYCFLVRPFSVDKVYQILDRYTKILTVPAKIFQFQFNKANHTIAYKKILYIESTYDKKILLVHTGGQYLFYNTISKIHKTLETSNRFYRVHRGCVVNLQFIKYVNPSFITMNDGHIIPIPVKHQKITMDYLKKMCGTPFLS